MYNHRCRANRRIVSISMGIVLIRTIRIVKTKMSAAQQRLRLAACAAIQIYLSMRRENYEYGRMRAACNIYAWQRRRPMAVSALHIALVFIITCCTLTSCFVIIIIIMAFLCAFLFPLPMPLSSDTQTLSLYAFGSILLFSFIRKWTKANATNASTKYDEWANA